MNCRRTIVHIAIICTGLLSFVAAFAEDDGAIPSHERQIAQSKGYDGPSETVGIESSIVLGAIRLGDDFEGLDGRVMRARVVTVLPGGTVAVHEHDARPGVAYVLEGEITEHRNDESDPLTRLAGTASFEKSGIVHWWVNDSGKNAKVLVVDIIPEDDNLR